MKKIFLFVLAVVVFSACRIGAKNDVKKIVIGEQTFLCEVANTTKAREVGLMNRVELETGHGMIFEFGKVGFHTFWMKDTPLDLDIIWIDENDTVSEFVSAPACLESPCPIYRPEKEAKYVVEVSVGNFTGVVGDKVRVGD